MPKVEFVLHGQVRLRARKEPEVPHLAGGGILGGISGALGTSDNFTATGANIAPSIIPIN